MDINVPTVGESVTSGILAVWLKQSGEEVKEGDELFELETDKATVAFPAPAAGVLKVLVEAGTEVEVGQQVATLEAGASAATPVAKTTAEAAEPATVDAEPALSPAVRKIVAQEQLDTAAIKGTGKGGRITREDALAAATAQAGEPAPVSTPVAPAPASVVPPATRGRTDSQGRTTRRVPLTPIRRRIAERLVTAKQNTAYLTTFNEIDMQAVSSIRSKYREAFEKEHGIRIGFMSFFVKAVCESLEAFPAINATLDGDDLVYHDYCDVGIAVSTDAGLLVPVIRSAGTMSFAEIEATIASFAQRARDRRLLPDELSGGTFSVTNGGVFGSLLSTPIPAYPQSAILGMHAITKRAVVVEDEIVIRPMMYVALTYDHRVVDGKEAIGFLKTIKEYIEVPDKLLLRM